MKSSLEIQKDPSGITYEYNIYVNDTLYMTGDGYETPDEAREDLEELRDVLIEVLK